MSIAAKDYLSKISGSSNSENKNSITTSKLNKMNGLQEEYNPFLDKNGDLINKYIDYQKILDNPNVTQKAKEYISKATGLTSTTGNKTKSLINKAANSSEQSTDFKKNIKSFDNNIADNAKKYIGTPYVWGGESMSEGGMDCSGFVYNALKDSGYDVGRTTAQGYRNYGTKVSKNDMQPGDLVFYGNGEASHIGIYIGNGQMIHSSGGSKNTKSNPGKGVSVANIDYRNDFIEARRY